MTVIPLAAQPSNSPAAEPPTDIVASAPPSFRHDVMAVLSKAGCNMGTCHGNQNGKGGFKLSLRGQDPLDDMTSITRDQFGRRINGQSPDQSLLLLKPTMQVAHEGGLRLKRESLEYDILRRWIEAGQPIDNADAARFDKLEVAPAEQYLVAPQSSVQLSAVALFSDGSRRDVTRMSVYESSSNLVSMSPEGKVTFADFGETTVLVRYLDKQMPVRLAYSPARPDFASSNPPANNFVDEHVFDKLRTLRMNPSELSTDTEFVRRVYLDLLGLLPTADEARTFLADSASDKRQVLVDRLLLRPEFAEHWALKWSDLLRNEEKVLDANGVQLFHGWLRESFAANKPLDRMVRELVAAKGSTYKNPPANYYRANRDPVSRAEATAQVFLGIRLQCAKCHNHPFDRWTQDDYYRWTALFARVDYKIVENKRKDKNDKHEFDGEQIVLLADKGEVQDPRTKQDAAPRFLGEREPLNVDNEQDRLGPLAAWLTAPDNDLFVRSQVNRIWYHLLGRGLVEPIDDFRASNPAVHPALLDALADDFVAHGFDVRHLIRTIVRSRTYQLSSRPNETNAGDEINFSRAVVKRLTAEQLLDALTQVVGSSNQLHGQKIRAGQLAGVNAMAYGKRGPSKSDGDKFLKIFGKPDRQLTCECERATETTLSQALQLLSGPTVHRLLSDESNRLSELIAGTDDSAALVAQLYWSALAREPSEAELVATREHLERSGDWRAALEDIAWGIVNSKEFMLRR